MGALYPPPGSGRSLASLYTVEVTGAEGTALVEDDQDDLGLGLRTLITERYRLTNYAGQAYGGLFDLQEDPDQLHNFWDDPG